MTESQRKSGIDIIGDVPWGTHFCQFYETKDDLIDLLVPYFKAGLENNEFCMWVTAEPLNVDDAMNALRSVIPDIDSYIEKGQLEIITYTDWYVINGNFDSNRVLNGWVDKLNKALDNGFNGLRLTGNTFWLEKDEWKDFIDYEEDVDNVIGKYRMLALCTYSLDKCDANGIIDVVNNHLFALIKREGDWTLVESSKQRKTEKELQVSEERFSLAVKAAQEGVWDWNMETDEVWYSHRYKEMLGYSDDEFEPYMSTWLQLLHPDDKEPTLQLVEAVKRGEREYEAEFRLQQKDGHYLNILSRGYPIKRESDGKIVRIIGTHFDFTERRQMEDALKEAYDDLELKIEERTKKLKMANLYNRSLIEASVDPLVTIGQDGKITDVNKSTETVTGLNRDVLIGTDFSDYFTEPDKAREGYQKVFQKGFVRDYPLEIRRKDGGKTPVLYNASVYNDENGDVIGVFAAARDMSELQKAEDEIQRLANVVESSDDAIITKSLDGYILSWNKGAEQIYGYSADEVVGKSISIIVPPFIKNEIADLIENVKIGQRIEDYETLRIKKDGTIINASIVLSPVLNTSGKLVAISTIARDITARKKVEEDLKLASIYNRSLIEASVDPLVTIGQDGKITDVNNSTEVVTGFSREELIDTDFSDYFTEPDKAREGYQKVFQEGYVRDYPLEIQHISGRVTPVLYNASVYRDESGKVIGVFAAARDITNLKKAEKELELAGKYNRSLIEASVDPLVTIGSDGKITDVNKSTEIITGYYRKELIGTNFSNYFTMPDEANEGYQKVFQEGIVLDYPLEIKHKNGHITPVLYNASVYKDESGKVIGVFAAARDITQQRQDEILIKEELKRNLELTEQLQNSNEELQVTTEELQTSNEELQLTTEELQTSNEELRSTTDELQIANEKLSFERKRLFDILETIPIMVCLLTPDYHVAFANHAFRERFGESHGRHCYEYCFGFDEPCDFCESYNVLETGEPHQWEVKSPDGSVIEAYDFPFTDASGKSLILEMDMDVTEQRDAQESLKDINRILEERVNDRTMDLQESQANLKELVDKLEVSNRELEQFAYVASHDLQEPLRMVSSFTQLLERKYKGQLDKNADDYIDFIVEGSHRMKDLIDDLLAFSRLNTQAHEFELFDMESSLKGVLSYLQPVIEKNNATITYDILPSLKGDSSQIQQLLQNLLSNAIKFTDDEQPRIHVYAEESVDEWRFGVSDNGIGINPEHQEQIFKVFKRLHTREEYEGSGIGLAICQKIVGRHNGRIWVESELGKGSIFYFTIPHNN